MPLGKQIIISTGKLYFSRCRSASFLWDGFSWLLYGDSWAQSRCLGPQYCPRGCSHPLCTYLQVLQLLYQGPGANEALIEESEDGRTFQDSLPESPP